MRYAEIDASVTTGRSLAEISRRGRRNGRRPSRRGVKGPAKPKALESGGEGLSKPPAFVPIQLCKVTDHPPGGTGWAHEIKFDGYRIQIGDRRRSGGLADAQGPGLERQVFGTGGGCGDLARRGDRR
jgi:hypothetical protein